MLAMQTHPLALASYIRPYLTDHLVTQNMNTASPCISNGMACRNNNRHIGSYTVNDFLLMSFFKDVYWIIEYNFLLWLIQNFLVLCLKSSYNNLQLRYMHFISFEFVFLLQPKTFLFCKIRLWIWRPFIGLVHSYLI